MKAYVVQRLEPTTDNRQMSVQFIPYAKCVDDEIGKRVCLKSRILQVRLLLDAHMIEEQIILPVTITMTDNYTCHSNCRFYRYISANHYEEQDEGWYCILFNEKLEEIKAKNGNKIIRCKECEEYSKVKKLQEILK
jgi:hypothetical protein